MTITTEQLNQEKEIYYFMAVYLLLAILKWMGIYLAYNRGYISGSWRDSLLPEVFSIDERRPPNIVLGKKAYLLKSKS